MTPEEVARKHRQQREGAAVEEFLFSLSPPVGGRIGNIGNTDGYLYAKKEGDKYFWAMSTYKEPDWEEITKSFFDELMRHRESLTQ